MKRILRSPWLWITVAVVLVLLALQYLVGHELFVKVVGGYAKTHYDFSFSTMTYDDDMFSVRVRLMYLY